MPKFEVRIDGLKQIQANFAKAPKEIFDGLTRAINTSALIITTEVKNVTPVKTGRLKTSIRASFSPLRASISPHVPYAIYVHEGTKPHIIRPRSKKALYWKGALHPVRSVNHPGTKANPFMQNGLNNAKEKVNDTFKKEVDKILSILAKK